MRPYLLASLAAAIACSGDATVAPASRKTAPSHALTIVALEVSPKSGTAVQLGSTLTLTAVAVRSDSSRVTAPELRWTSLNPYILSVNPVAGNAVAVGVGTVTVQVQGGGISASLQVRVLPPSAGPSTALTLESYSVIEFTYPSAPGQYYYAPQVRVTASAGRSIVVTLLQLKSLGFDPIPPIDCGGRIAAGATRDLNGESYGDWLFSFDRTGTRVTTGTVDTILTFVDDTGTWGSITVQAPVVAGTLPTTYGGPAGACFEARAP